MTTSIIDNIEIVLPTQTFINRELGVTTFVITAEPQVDNVQPLVAVGTSRQNHEDEYNQNIGNELALARALVDFGERLEAYTWEKINRIQEEKLAAEREAEEPTGDSYEDIFTGSLKALLDAFLGGVK